MTAQHSDNLLPSCLFSHDINVSVSEKQILSKKREDTLSGNKLFILNNVSRPTEGDDVEREAQCLTGYGIFFDVLLLLCLGLFLFLPGLNELSYKGEEPRRVICAEELLLSGNWFVPTIQGELFLSRPPFQNWVIALTGTLLGNFDHLSGRLPSFFSVLALTLLIYFYCRASFSGIVPILAGLFFLSTFHVIKYGSLAETEMLFTFLLAGSYLFWHLAEIRQWSNTMKWSVAYFLLALATLSKGFNQAPLYFMAIIGLHLILNRRLSNLLTRGHAIGLVIFFGIAGIWQFGFTYYAGWEATCTMHLGDVALRFQDNRISQYLKHWSLYPWEQFAVLFPWSFFLIAFFSRNFRNRLKPFSVPLQFCIGAIAITFFSVWFPAGAKTRYYLPMVPCFVILAAVVVEQCRLQMNCLTEKKERWEKLWSFFLNISIVIFPLIGIGGCIWTMRNGVFHDSLLPIQALIFLIVACSACVILIRFRRTTTRKGFVICAAVFVSFIAAGYNLLYVDLLKIRYENVGIQVQDVLKNIPPSTELYYVQPVSFVGNKCQFVYYYMLYTKKMLPVMPPNQHLQIGQYFCISEDDFSQWNPKQVEIIASVDCNRFKPEYSRKAPDNVLIGKLIDQAEDSYSEGGH